MNDARIGRRVFLGGTGLLAAAASSSIDVRQGHADQQVPFSAGTTAPKLKAPDNACDIEAKRRCPTMSGCSTS
jgi:hypothetical protein